MSEERFNQFRRKIGMLFQGAALFNSMTIEENVALPLRELTRTGRIHDSHHDAHQAGPGGA